VDQTAALAAFDEQLRRNPRGRFERAGSVVRCVGISPDDWSGIDWADLDESTIDTVIAEQVRFFADLGREFEWKYYSHDRPVGLPERLLRAGFQRGEDEALMIADIAGVPRDPVLPEGVRLVPVTDEAGLRQLDAVHEQAFGEGRAFPVEKLAEITPVLAMAGDVPVSGSWIEFHDGTEFASLWGGGTLESWRGKGIYRAMVSYRARLAAERGARYLRVDALPTSRPILERLGFARLSTTVPYTRQYTLSRQ
jgi:GNAT superfamily N-acetyltransferase